MLSEIIEELAEAYETLGFLRSQELLKKRDIWNADPNASIQARDRTATYGAADITAEIYQVEARIHVLNVRRSYLERCLPTTTSNI